MKQRTMSMEQSIEKQQDQISIERSIGNLFTDFLEKKNRLAEFDVMSKSVGITIDGVALRIHQGELTLEPKGFPATVFQALKYVVKATQNIVFQPAVASG